MKLTELAEIYLPHVQNLINASAGIRYEAMHLSPDASAISELNPIYAREALNEFRRIYVCGILERCHLVSITSLTRLSKWLEASVAMSQASNALAFSAALRGYLEASADSNDVMQYLPKSLKNAAEYFYVVIHRPEIETSIMAVFEALENKLIHFVYASKQPKIGPSLPNHIAETTAYYIRGFEKSGDVKGLEAMYAHLCDLTHPGSGSIFSFVNNETCESSFQPMQDKEIILELCSDYENTIQEMISKSLNASILTLSMLNIIIPEWPSVSSKWLTSNPNLKAYFSDFLSKVNAAASPSYNVHKLENSLHEECTT